MIGKNVLRHCENVFKRDRGHNTKRNLAIDPAEGEVVDLEAKGRNVGSLGRVHVHGQEVLSIEIEMLRQFEGKWRIAALVLAKFLAVDPHRRGCHYAFKVDED